MASWTKEDYAFWGLCECCGRPLHSEKPLRKPKHRARGGAKIDIKDTHSPAKENLDLSIDAILKWIDKDEKHKRRPKRQTKKCDASDSEIKEFAKAILLQSKCQQKISMCPEGKAKIVEFCKRKLN